MCHAHAQAELAEARSSAGAGGAQGGKDSDGDESWEAKSRELMMKLVPKPETRNLKP